MSKKFKEVEIGFVIKVVGEESYYDCNNEEFTSMYAECEKYSATIFDTIDEAESIILDGELEDYEDLEIFKVEKSFKVLEKYNRIKVVKHEKVNQ